MVLKTEIIQYQVNNTALNKMNIFSPLEIERSPLQIDFAEVSCTSSTDSAQVCSIQVKEDPFNGIESADATLTISKDGRITAQINNLKVGVKLE